MNDEYNNEQQEKKGVSLKSAGLFLALIVIVLIFVIILVRGCSVSKEVSDNGAVQNQEQANLVDEANNTTNEGNDGDALKTAVQDTEKEVANTEKSVENNASTEVTQSDTENVQNSTTENAGEPVATEAGDVALEKCDVPILGDNLETSVMIAGKDVYNLGGVSYVYMLNLIFPNGEGYDIVKYPCSRKVYDAVALGDTVTASYQVDESGVISVTSISK